MLPSIVGAMKGRAVLLSVLVALAVAVAGIAIYEIFFANPVAGARNWAGYADPETEGSAGGAIAIPSQSAWSGNGVAALWVGLGGFNDGASTGWPFWQAGAVVTCSAGACTLELFTEGGTASSPCNGTCPIVWSQQLGVDTSATVTVDIAGGSSGATAEFTVYQDGFNASYDPPPWTVLAGVSSFPSAEWIFESPQGTQGTEVMPTLSPPGALFSGLSDSTSLATLTLVEMEDNPNGQSVVVSAISGNSFSAYSTGT